MSRFTGTPNLPGRVAALVIGVLALVACGDPGGGTPEPAGAGQGPSPGSGSPESPSPPPLAPPWVAPPASNPQAEGCAACHPGQTESWARTGMARALSPIQGGQGGEFEGLEPVWDGDYTYTLEHRADGVPVIVERCDQVPEHRLEAELVYAIGAGELDRAFVARLGQFEWFAPLEVVSVEGGRHAALAPGHMAVPHQRFSVAITPECLGCHTEAPPPPSFPLNLHQPEWTPRGIGCAACHGQVETHARLLRAADEGSSQEGGTRADDPVLRFGELSRTQRMSICAACHLQGDARISFDGSLGIPPPGGDLLEQRAVFVGREVNQDIGFVSHTERLVLSSCYLEDRSMACDTCHDPHQTLFEAPERLRVRAACQTCHPGELQLPGAEASACSRAPELNPEMAADARDCVDCHMRRTTTFDVAEVRIFDHFIRKHPGAPSPERRPRTLESPGADWKRFAWPDEPEPEHLDDPGLWLMALSHRGQLQRAAELLEARPGPRVERIPMYHHAVGSLLERLGRPELAVPSYQRALELDPDLAPSSINLGRLIGTGGDPARGIGMLSRVLAQFPAAVNALRNRAALRGELGDREGFERDLIAAFELQPLPELAEILANWFRASGDPERANAWSERSRALNPLPQGR